MGSYDLLRILYAKSIFTGSSDCDDPTVSSVSSISRTWLQSLRLSLAIALLFSICLGLNGFAPKATFSRGFGIEIERVLSSDT